MKIEGFFSRTGQLRHTPHHCNYGVTFQQSKHVQVSGKVWTTDLRNPAGI